MDSKRTVGQLNRMFHAQYRARFAEDDLILESAEAALYTILGVVQEDVSNQSFFDLVMPSDIPRLKSDMKKQLESGNEIELIVMTRNGDWVLNRGVRYETEDGSYLEGVLVTINQFKRIYDIQKQRLVEYAEKLSEITVRASRDSLTMLCNAQTTRTLCEEYIAETDDSFALMVVDVDGFKHINDDYGHIVGDKVLVCVAGIIKKLFRSGDVVGRIGGDEFLVLMKGVETRDIVDRRSEQILEAFTGVSFEGIPQGSLSCSVGVVFASKENTQKYDELFCIADKAMYRAKSSGGNQFKVYRV